MRLWVAFVTDFVLLSVLVFGVTDFFVYKHEVVHKTIFAYGGCDSEIKLFPLALAGVTIPEENCTLSPEYEYLHLQNEMFGNHIIIPVILLTIILFIQLYGLKRG